MIRFEALALAISNLNGGLNDPDSKAFKLHNPGLLKTYRPEKKKDGDNYRIFTSVMGGFKALIAELQARCSGKNHRLTPDNTLSDMLALYSVTDDRAIRQIVLFIRRALQDDSVAASTRLAWFQETAEQSVEIEQEK